MHHIHEVGDARGEYFGFAAACTGDDHQGAFGMGSGFELWLIQSLQVILHRVQVKTNWGKKEGTGAVIMTVVLQVYGQECG